MSGKPTVMFVGAPTFVLSPSEYEDIAYVHALDHPTFGECLVRTSLVERKHEDGSFETINTIYKPAIKAEPAESKE